MSDKHCAFWVTMLGVGAWGCDRCGTDLKKLSKNRQIYEDAVACVTAAIARALSVSSQAGAR